MYKVLIVDDEPLIREGLQTIVEWAELGFEVAGSASDGVDALQKAPQLGPDLMIVDVRMPGMDGLSLIRTLQERPGPRPHFLILSGHADFEYARQALAMRADGYLLKPVDEDELAEHLVKLKTILDAERDGNRKKPAASGWSRERTIASLLTGDGERAPEQAIAEAGLTGSSFETLLIKLQSRKEIDPEAAAGVKRSLIAAYEASDRGAVLSADPYLAVVLKNVADEAEAHDAAYRTIAKSCAGFGLDFTAVGGGVVSEVLELHRSYRNAQKLMRGRFTLEGDRVHVRDAAPAEPAAGERREAPDLQAAGEKLFLALDIGNEEYAVSIVKDTGAAMVAAGTTEQGIKAGFVQLVTTALGRLEQNRPELRARAQAFASEVLDIYAEYRYSGLIGTLTERVRDMAEAFRGQGPDKQLQKMIDLIHRNYRENLRLGSLAELFGYNSSYLGKLFKNATGESFNTYLDKVRIEKAKELLGAGMKVYQVAERVGYSNVDYFHGKFRKYVGTSPSAFRK
ncbi:response regulator transcription factor [Cohnella thermotolerans]|uniref:response regulator transcription factor n=1 Tax=Cohnella thermotolerans TaxID=329858 RepID=UPI00041673A6|nr:response regulator transcription factor [Cohnella thermotolerans]